MGQVEASEVQDFQICSLLLKSTIRGQPGRGSGPGLHYYQSLKLQDTISIFKVNRQGTCEGTNSLLNANGLATLQAAILPDKKRNKKIKQMKGIDLKVFLCHRRSLRVSYPPNHLRASVFMHPSSSLREAGGGSCCLSNYCSAIS